MAANRFGSILAVDFGNVHTRAVLIDLVDGVYRLVAQAEGRTTIGFPVADVRVGLNRVVHSLTDTTGRELMTRQGFEGDEKLMIPEGPDRTGVDHFVATASIGHPLRTVLVGLVPGMSIASGQRAAAGTYVDIVETLSLDDTRSEEELINAITHSRPNLIFITGGTENGATEPLFQLVRIVHLALQLMTNQRKPTILYAGNSVLTPKIQAAFEGLTTVLTTSNVRPSLDEEELEGAQLQLARAFDTFSAQRGAGFEEVGQLSRFGIMPTAQSYNLVVDYLGRATKGGVLSVDIGSAASTLSASFNGQVATSIRTDIGLGHSAQNLLEGVGADAVRAWIPFNVSREEVTVYSVNKTLRPAGIPESVRNLYVEHALLRAGIQALVEASRPAWKTKQRDGLMPPVHMLVGAGAALTHTGRPGVAAMLLLDTIAPVGVTTLYSDPYALIPALGAIARQRPEAVVQVLDSGSLERLGTSASVSGEPRPGRPAMRVKITVDGQTIKQDVEGGRLWIYPLPPGKRAKVEVRALGRGLSIGGKGRVKFEADGGLAGLIFDARGRPLPLARDARGRAAQMPLWMADATGDAVKPIDEAWLAPLVEDEPKPVPVKDRKEEKKPAKAPKPKKEKEKKVKATKGDSKGKQAAAPDELPPEEGEGDELDELRKLLS